MTWGTDCPQCGKNDCKWVRGSICDGNVEQQFATLQRELEAAREREMQWGSLLKVAERELEAVRAERDALREAEADARSTLTAWFAERDKLREATTENLMAALNGYLRTSESGGMPGELADAVRGVLADFCRLDGVADLLHEAVRQARAVQQPAASGRASPVTQAELDDCYGQGLPLPPSEDGHKARLQEDADAFEDWRNEAGNGGVR